MDFSKLDSRSAAETGRKVHILDQQTGEPIYDGDTACCFFIRGNSSRSVQAAIKAEQTAKMMASRKQEPVDPKAPRKPKPVDEDKTFEDIHQDLVTAAARLITGFSGVQRAGDDGALRDLTTSAADVKWFLDLNFVSLEHLLRKAALTKGEDETPADFADRQTAYEAQWHKPSFAQQVLEAAQDDADFLRQTSQS